MMDGFISIHRFRGNRLKSVTTFLLFCLFAAVPARGQLAVGLRTGLNISQTTLSNLPQTTVGDLFSVDRLDGFFVGPLLRIPMPVSHLGLEVALLYDQHKTEINEKTINQQSLVVPVNGRFDVSVFDFLGAYVAAGPQLSFNVGREDFTWTDSQQMRNTFRIQSSSFGFNVGGGIRFDDLEAGVVYQIPLGRAADLISLSDTMDRIYEVRSATTNTWQIALTYYF